MGRDWFHLTPSQGQTTFCGVGMDGGEIPGRRGTVDRLDRLQIPQPRSSVMSARRQEERMGWSRRRECLCRWRRRRCLSLDRMVYFPREVGKYSWYLCLNNLTVPSPTQHVPGPRRHQTNPYQTKHRAIWRISGSIQREKILVLKREDARRTNTRPHFCRQPLPTYTHRRDTRCGLFEGLQQEQPKRKRIRNFPCASSFLAERVSTAVYYRVTHFPIFSFARRRFRP